jgi:hypothetical protein
MITQRTDMIPGEGIIYYLLEPIIVSSEGLDIMFK